MRWVVAPCLVATVICAAGCPPPETPGRPCDVDSECPVGDSCVGGACTYTGRIPIPDPQPDEDAGAPRVDAGSPAVDAGDDDDAGLVADGGDPDGGDPDGGDPDGGVNDWWNDAWSSREKVRLHAVMHENALNDIAVGVRLVDVIPDDERSVDDVDVRFVDDDGVTVLPYELEGSGATAVAWVLVPTISPDTSDDFVWVYWGNATATPAEDAPAVWQGWEAVLHLDEVVGDVYEDSTGNGHDAPFGTTTLADGAMGGAARFDGTGGVTPADLAGADFPQDSGTVFLSVYVDDRVTAGDVFDTPVATGGQLFMELNGTGGVRIRARQDGANAESFGSSIYPQWTTLSVAWDVASDTFRPLRDTSGPATADAWTLEDFRPDAQQSVLGASFSGRVDELRVASRALGVAEIEMLRATVLDNVTIVGEAPRPPDVAPRTLARVADTTVLYELDEGTGTLAEDTGAADLGLDLTLDQPTRVEWTQGGVWFRGRALFSRADSPGLATACAAGDLTVEAWVASDNTQLNGPARVFTYSLDTGIRNFTLGQEGTRYSLRFRTSDTGDNGDSNTTSGDSKPHTGSGTLEPGTPQHVVFVRSGDALTSYRDGQPVVSRTWPGDVAGVWGEDYGLGIGNEFGGDRPWLGGVYLLAVYCRALSEPEIQQNFAAGP